MGWDVKAMHRLIVTSSTFRQSSRIDAELLKRDPSNRLLARGPRFRLTGAAIRDGALAVSGLLSETMGGPSVKPYQPPGLWGEVSFGTGKTTIDFYEQDEGENLYRRSLYTFWKRTVAPPLLSNFDGGGREACRVRSDVTNTPMQALNLQNDVTFVEAARHLAERMIADGGESDSQLAYGWRLALGRAPTADELEVLRGSARTPPVDLSREPRRGGLAVGQRRVGPQYGTGPRRTRRVHHGGADDSQSRRNHHAGMRLRTSNIEL